MEERTTLRCPLCGAEMTGGDVVCKTGAGPTLDPRVEVAAYPDGRTTLVINNSLEPVTTTVPTPQGPRTVRLEEGGHQWLTAASQ